MEYIREKPHKGGKIYIYIYIYILISKEANNYDSVQVSKQYIKLS